MPIKQFRSAGPMTLNNYTPEEVEHLRACTLGKDSKIKYITWNQEIGENGTPKTRLGSSRSVSPSAFGSSPTGSMKDRDDNKKTK